MEFEKSSDKIQIISNRISRVELKTVAEQQFGDMVKAVVDIERKIMAIGGEMHADEEALLLENGSRQSDLWGINIYPGNLTDQWIEFDSMINIRPNQKNRSRGVEDAETRKNIVDIVNSLVK
ncbi:MAG: DUF5674 family protein [Parcubacteria group bacterium]